MDSNSGNDNQINGSNNENTNEDNVNNNEETAKDSNEKTAEDNERMSEDNDEGTAADNEGMTEDNNEGTAADNEGMTEDNNEGTAEDNNEGTAADNEGMTEDNNEGTAEDNNEGTAADNEGMTEDNNEGMAAVNERMAEDNNEEADEPEDGEDIFTLMYGRDEEFEDESEDENNSLEDSDRLNVEINPSLESNQNRNQNKRSSSDLLITSSKRRSESDCSQTKRIKSEPTDPKIEDSVNQMTTTVETAEEEVVVPIDIPNNSFELMSYLLNLNANDLELNFDLKRFSMSRNLQNISQTLRFNDLELFRKTFIPYILSDLWQKLCHHYKDNHKNNVNVMSLKYFLSILTKIKSQKMLNGLEMRCISVVRPKEGPVFKFGQLITIQTAVQPKPNSSTHIITKRKYFGYITSHLIRATNSENQSEVNHLRLLNESRNNSVLVEEIHFMTKYSDELYLRNDALIVAEPIVSVHNNYMESRSVFKFEEFPLYKQIFNPIFNARPSGLSVTLNEKKFSPQQIEVIQIALDIVANSHSTYSSFMAINGSKDSPKQSILAEIIRQIVLCQGLSQTKVLFTSSDYNTMKTMDQIMKTRKIKTYFVENDFESSLKEFAVKHIEHKLSKETDPQKKEWYEESLQYFDFGHELSVESALFKNSILDKLRNELINNCSVIIGRIEDLCNDIVFYKHFTNQNHSIGCCIIDDAMSVSETQLYSLFWFGFPKFLFAGEYRPPKDYETNICRAYGLSRSFFERYYSLYLQNNDSNQSTVFNV